MLKVSLLMPAFLERSDALGAKIVSVFPENPTRGEPPIKGAIILLDAHSGTPRALLDGTRLTEIRTAAGSGLATELLADADAGIAVPPGDADALVGALRSLTADPGAAEAMGRRELEEELEKQRRSHVQSLETAHRQAERAERAKQFLEEELEASRKLTEQLTKKLAGVRETAKAGFVSQTEALQKLERATDARFGAVSEQIGGVNGAVEAVNVGLGEVAAVQQVGFRGIAAQNMAGHAALHAMGQHMGVDGMPALAVAT